ncbi:MAG TPA: DUF262 domain-containing protein [Pseudolabrys sp.]
MVQDVKTIVEERLDDGNPAGVEIEPEDSSVSIKEPFDPERIKVRTDKKTIDLLVKRIGHGEIDLAPEFQRRARIWDQGRKGRLIESILLRIPLPVFYVAADGKDKWSVVDGLQRLTTISDFMSTDMSFGLSGLEYLKNLEGLNFAQLKRPMQRRIEETELVINVIEAGTPDEVMINIFKRINTEGVRLNGQEIRHALHKGPARKFLQTIAESDTFREATSHSVRDDRMAARECVLRFSAFWLTPWEKYSSSDLDGFLSDAMRKLNRMSDQQRDTLAADFKRAMVAAKKIFRDDAFRKRYDTYSGRNPVSKALFESWSVNLARLEEASLTKLVGLRERVIHSFIDLMKDDRSFDVSISYSTGDPKRVSKRFGAIQALIKQVLS